MGGDNLREKRRRRLETPTPPRSPVLPTADSGRNPGVFSGERRSRSRTRHTSRSRERSRSHHHHRSCRSNRKLLHNEPSTSRHLPENRPSRARDLYGGSEQRSRSRSKPKSSRRSRSHSRRGSNRRSRSHSRKRNYDHDALHERLRLLEKELLKERSYNAALRNSSDRRQTEPVNFFEEFVNIFKGKDRESFPVLHNVLPDYDPLSKEQTIDMWISKVDECAEIYSWNDKQTVHYALPKLSGHAKTWYQGLPSIKHSWVEWKRLLRESFPSTENYAELLTEMLNRKARPGDSLELYYFAKINLLNRCKIFGKHAVDCLIFGIEDKGVRLSAQAGKFNKPEETLEFFKTVKTHPRENTDIRRESNIRDRRFPNVSTSSTTVPIRSSDHMKNRAKGNNVCFNCNEAGHMSYQCRKPINKCSECNFLGHNSSACPRKNSNNSNISSNTNNTNNSNSSLQSKSKNVLEVLVDDDSNDKYRIVIKINGINTPCQVDLGSQATLIRKTDAHKIGLRWDSVEGPMLRGLGNIPYLPIGKALVTIEVHDIKEEQVEVLVVDDSLINIPVLLGHSFTERPNLRIVKTASDLQIEKVNLHDEPKLMLVTTDDIYLDVGKLDTILVNAGINFSGNIYVGGSIRGRPGMEFYLLPGEYQMNNGVCRVLIQNLGSQPLSFNKGTLISRARTSLSQKRILDVLRVNAESVDHTVEQQINVGAGLSINQKEQCQTLLSKYKGCFSTGLHDLGYTSVAEMEIHLTDTTPVVYRPYRLSQSEREYVQGLVEEMMENGIVRESSSPYASPIVLVQKKSGEKRLCVDYRALNRRTKRDHYPLPRIEDLLDQLSGQTLFTTLDLASGYHQIAIAERSKEKTAFVTPEGQYEYNRMPFGLANAPAVFQRVIHKILNKTKVPYVIIYMDDILIPSKTFDEGLQRLEEVLRLLQEAGLTLKMEKCNFFQESIVFLGFEIDKFGIRPGVQKTQAVSKFPIPRNQSDVRRFLGLAGFFRRFVKDFALLARPLTNLLKKDTAWQWSESQQSAFENLKKLLIERPLLAIYNHSAETQLHTDASKFGLGGILMQRTGSDPWRPVSYYSRQTSPDEQKLHSFELETLAVICALNKFRTYLLGIKFTIVSDCNALRSTFTKRDLIPRISRWWIQFLEYDCNIEYRPGEKMAHVDALSRGAIVEDQEPVHVLDILNVKVDDWISTVQSADEEVRRIKEIIEDPETAKIAAIHKEYQVKNGRVYRIIEDGVLRWLVPKGVRWQVLKTNHDDIGHFGFEKTLQRVKSLFWFPKMRKFVRKYVSACLECAHHKVPSGAKEGMLHPIPKIDVPLHTLHADHLGPFPRSRHGNMYILVIVDSFTKYVYLAAVRSTKSKASIKVFKNFFSLFGSPSRLITDRGTSFTSKRFKSFINSVGVKHILNSVATPRANGQVERYNRTILASLGSMTHGKDSKTWDSFLPDVQLGINTTVHDVTKRTPNELLFGRNLGNPSQGILNNISEEISESERSESIEKIRSDASDRIKENQRKNKERFDKHRKTPTKYKEGDLVRVVRAIVVGSGKSKKLESKCQGPYRIKKVLPNDRFLVVDTPLTRKGKSYENVVSIDKIYPWMSFNAPADSSSDESTSQNE